MPIITPTVGRVVLFYPGSNFTGVAPVDGEPLPALISRVWNDSLINIGGFDAEGKPFAETSVALLQYNEPEDGWYHTGWAEWMPYQKEQAAKQQAMQTQPSLGASAADDLLYRAHEIAKVVMSTQPHRGCTGKEAGEYSADFYNAIIKGITQPVSEPNPFSAPDSPPPARLASAPVYTGESRISFDELIEFGKRDSNSRYEGGMPTGFVYFRHGVCLADQDCYLIGTSKIAFRRGQWLILGADNNIRVEG